MARPKGNPAERLPVGDRVTIFTRNGVWQANCQINGKQIRKSLKTKNRREAVLRAQRLETELAKSHQASLELVEATVPQVTSAFIEKHVAQNKAAKTLVKYRRNMKEIEDLAIQQRVTHASQLDYRFADVYQAAQRTAGNGDTTIRGKLGLLRSLTLFAVSRKMVETDPLEDYPLPKAKPAPQECWSWEEAEKIVQSSPPAYQPMFEFLRLTGTRIAEATHLTWADIDSVNGAIHIRPKADWKPKSGDQRIIQVPPRLIDQLRLLPRLNDRVFTAPVSKQYPEAGRPVSPRSAYQVLQRVLAKLSLTGKLHTFRHTYISHLLLNNTPAPVVRKLVGHVDRKTIEFYTHVREDKIREFVLNL